MFFFCGRHLKLSHKFSIKPFPWSLPSKSLKPVLYDKHLSLSSQISLTGVFLDVAETIVGLLLCCSVGIVQCIFNPFCITLFGDRTRPQHQGTIHNWQVVKINRTH